MENYKFKSDIDDEEEEMTKELQTMRFIKSALQVGLKLEDMEKLTTGEIYNLIFCYLVDNGEIVRKKASQKEIDDFLNE